MNRTIKRVLTFCVTFSISASLLYWSFKDIALEEFWYEFKNLDSQWFVYSVLIGFLSHYLRALRWNLQLKSIGYDPGNIRAFYAIMSGYLINLVILRVGELARVSLLKKSDGVPIAQSMGTLIVERVVDLLLLLLMGLLAFNFEYDFFNNMMIKYVFPKDAEGNKLVVYVFLLLVMIIGILIWKKFKNQLMASVVVKKCYELFLGVKEGVIAIFKMEQKGLFILYSLAIWICYYYMTYIIIYGLDHLIDVPWYAGILLLVMGAVGMAAPVQGGIGVYHILISAVLVYYGFKESQGILLATVMHTAQTLMVLVVGGVSLVLINIVTKRKSKITVYYKQNNN